MHDGDHPAQQALQRDINLKLLLPCNVVVYEEGSQIQVGAVDAVRMLSVVNHPEMEPLARQVNERLRLRFRQRGPAAGRIGRFAKPRSRIVRQVSGCS